MGEIIKRKIIVLRGYLAAGKSATFANLKSHEKMKDWIFLDFPAIRKMFDNNARTQVEFADKTFYTSLKELLKTGKDIVTQETSEKILREKMGKEIDKNKYNVQAIVLIVSPETSYLRATARSKRKGRKPRTKEEVYKNHRDRKVKLSEEKLFIDADKYSEKQVVSKIIKLVT